MPMTRTVAPRSLPLAAIVGGFVVVILSAAELMAGSSKPSSTTPKPVHVREYKRKDGSIVKAHDRAAPGTATGPAVSAPRSPSQTSRRTPSSHAAAATASKTTMRTTTAPGRSPVPASPNRDASGRTVRSTAVQSTRKIPFLPWRWVHRAIKGIFLEWIHLPEFDERST